LLSVSQSWRNASNEKVMRIEDSGLVVEYEESARLRKRHSRVPGICEHVPIIGYRRARQYPRSNCDADPEDRPELLSRDIR
jgi:hypothetical protein